MSNRYMFGQLLIRDDHGLVVFAEVVAGSEKPEGSEELTVLLGALYVPFYVSDECCGFPRIDSRLLISELACHWCARVLSGRMEGVTQKKPSMSFQP